MRERVRYYPDTDTMYVELRDGMVDGGEEAGKDLVIYYSEDDVALGYEIESASQHPEHIEAALKLLREIDLEQRSAAA
ncbi:MAG: DUF2283 domain-containing protein [Janthinobacterium lividum]